MEEIIIDRPLERSMQLIGAWPGCTRIRSRIIVWIIMSVTLTGQFYDMFDWTEFKLSGFMEGMALTVTHVLSFVKIFSLWYYRGYIEECMNMIKEDWKTVTNEADIALMSRYAKIARRVCTWVIVSYHSSLVTFFVLAMVKYTPGNSNYKERTQFLRLKYPVEMFRTPNFEIFLLIGIGQAWFLVAGNFMADSFLITMIAHISGQLDVLHGRIIRLTDAKEFHGIIHNHRRLIHFADRLQKTYKWIGLSEFLSGSVIICAMGFLGVSTLESDVGRSTTIKFGTYIIAMITGVFIYGCAGDILIQQSLKIRDAAYENDWVGLPPETSRMLMMIMIRAERPLCITAGDFFAMNYGSFVNIMKTSVSYIGVVRARNE